MVKHHLEYIRVTRNLKNYRVYLKDLKNVIRLERRDRPPVPVFEDKSLSEISDQTSIPNRNSTGS